MILPKLRQPTMGTAATFAVATHASVPHTSAVKTPRLVQTFATPLTSPARAISVNDLSGTNGGLFAAFSDLRSPTIDLRAFVGAGIKMAQSTGAAETARPSAGFTTRILNLMQLAARTGRVPRCEHPGGLPYQRTGVSEVEIATASGLNTDDSPIPAPDSRPHRIYKGADQRLMFGDCFAKLGLGYGA